MDTTSIRNFAVAARERLIAGVDERLNMLGFDAEGNIPEENRPVRIEGGAKFRGEVLSDTSFFEKWTKLASDVRHRGRKEVRDAVAYTWFNRFCAIRIMAKRGFISPVLEYVGNKDARTPAIVASMRAGEQQKLFPDERNRLDRIRFDDTKTTEQFAILVMAFCRNNDVIRKCFGRPVDYTDLLLPYDILSPGGFVDALNDPETITDEDYQKDELIGWLYQYYISARKQEVFDSFKDGKKAEAEDIPAATEIFTPNWIVKYMVENSLGRLAIENGLGGDFTAGWKYLLQEDEKLDDSHLRIDSPEDISFADVACGSGHILLEGFRHLMEIYAEAGYSRRQSVECIFRKNLLGIDLDARARQLSQFALLLAAMSIDRSFDDAKVMPRVLDMEDTLEEGAYSRAEIAELLSVQDDSVLNELCEAFALLTQAHNLGSLMDFQISERTRGILAVKVDELEMAATDALFDLSSKYLPSFRLILALTARYSALAMNPPYMGSGNMNVPLKDYLEEHYRDGKNDLMTAFMLFAVDHVQDGGRWAMINLPSWMFISSFENLRRNLVESEQIVGLVHNGRGIFGSDFGSVTFVFEKVKPNRKGFYRRLFKEHVQVRSVEKIHQLYLDPNYGCYESDQRSFTKIPSTPIAYWVGDKMIKAFEGTNLNEIAKPRQGLATGCNAIFLRSWHEVSFDKMFIRCKSRVESTGSPLRWYPYNKGGEFRKWYGNQEFVIDWEDDGKRVRQYHGSVIRNPDTYFKESVSWSKISSGAPAFRFFPVGFVYDVAGTSIFATDKTVQQFLLGFCNSTVAVAILKVLSPTMNFEVGHIASLPILFASCERTTVETNVKDLIALSCNDWDEHETSWNFRANPLVESYEGRTLEEAYCKLAETWRAKTLRMKELEEANNRLFIEAYGLQDELSPDVPLHQVSLKCNPNYRYGVVAVKDETLEINGGESELSGETLSSTALQGPVVGETLVIDKHDKRLCEDTIKELISYAIGCLMGRYSLEQEGLILASQGETIADYWKKVGGEDAPDTARSASAPHRLVPDDDGIIPVVAGETAFTDNAPYRVVDFIKVAFGEEHLTENLNFIEATLGMTLEAYLAKGFWDDHKRMYKNRPIYWLFRSKKGAFQALVYMHRMDAYTATKVRNGYLLPHIEFLRGRIAAESARGAELTAKERTKLKKMQQAMEECLEYDGRLHVVADRMQGIDLDDGVAVNYAKFGDVLAKLK